jgi:hypothetical protein
MEQAGDHGTINVRLVSATPAPPIKGNNAWTLEVTDASGAPLDGLTLTVKPYMPDHRHGSSITPQVAAAGHGTYDVTLLNLGMPGIWTVTFDVAAAGSTGDAGATDSATFTFCIAG